ncbi:MAG: metallophosphoesterase [Armatimonadetes bacterium]|nr:metallophosphoesterase [Armatimonadota bacterium]
MIPRNWLMPALAAVSSIVVAAGEWLRPQVVQVELPVPNLPASLDGFRVCQLSDFHRGPLVPSSLIERGSEAAMAQDPDLIVLTGDFVSASWRYADSCAGALSNLSAPRGVYAILGNHDYWEGATVISRNLERRGIGVLCNESVPLAQEGWLCGLDDVIAGKPDFDRTLQNVPEDSFKLLLCHEPDHVIEASLHGFQVQLSGHTHGGQIRLPFFGPIVLPEQGQKFPAGLARYRDTLLYTNVGLGVVTVPLRVQCPPEVTLITLRRAAG